jgi:hypothetical protein
MVVLEDVEITAPSVTLINSTLIVYGRVNITGNLDTSLGSAIGLGLKPLEQPLVCYDISSQFRLMITR